MAAVEGFDLMIAREDEVGCLWGLSSILEEAGSDKYEDVDERESYELYLVAIFRKVSLFVSL